MRFGQFFVSGFFVLMVIVLPVISLLAIPAVGFMIYSDHYIEMREQAAKRGEKP